MQEKFDFEYLVRGQKPPENTLALSTPSSEAKETKPPSLPPKPMRQGPPKPVRADLNHAEEEEPEAPPRIPVREKAKPAARPLTILEAPPVRPPRQGEVAQLTSQFNRMSQTSETMGISHFDGFSSFGAPTAPPPRSTMPITRTPVAVAKPLPAPPGGVKAPVAATFNPASPRKNTLQGTNVSSSSSEQLSSPQISVNQMIKSLNSPADMPSPSSSPSPSPSAGGSVRKASLPPTPAEVAKMKQINSSPKLGYGLPDQDRRK